MNSIFICLGVIFGIASALPVDKDREALLELLFRTDANGRNNVLESALISALEDFRQTMVTGSDSIPVLDPFVLDRLHLDEAVIPVHGAKVEINDLIVSKLSTFELKEVSVSIASVLLQRYNVVIDIQVPVIDLHLGDYDLNLSSNGLSIFGNGDGKVTLIEPRVTVELLVGIRPRLGIYLNVLSTNIEVSITDIEPELTGLFNNPNVDSFVNLFLKHFILEFLDNFSEQITATINPVFQNVANDILDDINFINILG